MLQARRRREVIRINHYRYIRLYTYWISAARTTVNFKLQSSGVEPSSNKNEPERVGWGVFRGKSERGKRFPREIRVRSVVQPLHKYEVGTEHAAT